MSRIHRGWISETWGLTTILPPWATSWFHKRIERIEHIDQSNQTVQSTKAISPWMAWMEACSSRSDLDTCQSSSIPIAASSMASSQCSDSSTIWASNSHRLVTPRTSMPKSPPLISHRIHESDQRWKSSALRHKTPRQHFNHHSKAQASQAQTQSHSCRTTLWYRAMTAHLWAPISEFPHHLATPRTTSNKPSRIQQSFRWSSKSCSRIRSRSPK